MRTATRGMMERDSCRKEHKTAMSERQNGSPTPETEKALRATTLQPQKEREALDQQKKGGGRLMGFEDDQLTLTGRGDLQKEVMQR